jgi:hypothetical protein
MNKVIEVELKLDGYHAAFGIPTETNFCGHQKKEGSLLTMENPKMYIMVCKECLSAYVGSGWKLYAK